MAIKLDELVRFKVSADLDAFSIPPTDRNSLELALFDKYMQDLRKDFLETITEEEIAKKNQKVKRELQKKRLDGSIASIKTFIIEGIFLATLLGLGVNQATDIITLIKQVWHNGDYFLPVTLIVLVLISGLVVLYIVYRLVTLITSVLSSTANDED